MTRFVVALIGVTLLGLWGAGTWHVSADDGTIGHIKKLSGEASVVRGDTSQPATLGEKLVESDEIVTGPDGSVGIVFADNTVFSIGPNTHLALEEFAYNPSTLEGSMLANLLSGTLAVKTGDIARGSPDAVRLRTPSAILGVRGTRFLVRVSGAEGEMAQ